VSGATVTEQEEPLAETAAAMREMPPETARGPLAALRFAARNRMLSPEYARLLLRYLRLRLLTSAGRRWRTDGMVFLGPRLQLQIGRSGQIRFGRFVWVGEGTKIRCHEGVVDIGTKTVIGQEVTVSAYQRVRIGEQCVIADRAMFIDFDHVVVDPETPIRLQGIYKRDVTVGSNVWIGYGAQILRGVTIGDNAIIGASSVVTRDIPANGVAVGTPARVVRMRPVPERLTWPNPVEPAEYGPSGPR
jgi:acetyltransferase-like isoleucine patch superfamily enzyme